MSAINERKCINVVLIMFRVLSCHFPHRIQGLARSVCVVLLLAGPGLAWAETAIDGVYLSEDHYYRDALQGNVPVGKTVKFALEFRIENGRMAFIQIQAPYLEGIDRLYSRVRGLGCVYTSLGYPIVYPGSSIKVTTRHGVFEIQYQSNGKNIFKDAFMVTNLGDGKTQTYQWKDQVGRVWFDDAPLKYDAAAQTYSFQLSPQFLPENYAGKFRQEGVLSWFNELKVSFSHGQGSGALELGCPGLPIKFKLKKIKPDS